MTLDNFTGFDRDVGFMTAVRRKEPHALSQSAPTKIVALDQKMFLYCSHNAERRFRVRL
jgi:hypothetical protein